MRNEEDHHEIQQHTRSEAWHRCSLRDCFPIALSTSRREAVVQAYGEGLYNCPVTVENETDALKALEDVRAAGCNALVVYLGNFGPETRRPFWPSGSTAR